MPKDRKTKKRESENPTSPRLRGAGRRTGKSGKKKKPSSQVLKSSDSPVIKSSSSHPTRPAVVVVLGHIDHGKTTLLDYIRKSRVAAKEAGGITQSIGAYQVEIGEPDGESENPPAGRADRRIGESGKKKKPSSQVTKSSDSPVVKSSGSKVTRRVTFIDTPGHEAFAKMRSRGAAVADIAILVVAADDGVMPQTKEAIAHAKAAGISIVVALNKIDLKNVEPQKTRGQLAKEGVVPEDQGGDVPVVPVSAKTGKGVPELLEMVGLVADLLELESKPEAPLLATIVESSLSAQQGPLATVVMKEGTVGVSDEIIAAGVEGKVKALIDDCGKRVKKAGPGMAVEVLGFSEVPPVGSAVETLTGEKRGQAVKALAKKEGDIKGETPSESQDLNVVLRADAQGSLEAVASALSRVKVDDRGINILLSGVGQIVDSDIYLVQSANGVVLGFNVSISPSARKLAADHGVGARSFTIIYELLETAEKLLKGVKEMERAEIKGEGEVIKTFTLHSGDIVLGVRVTVGKIKYRDRVKVMRKEEEIHQGRVRGLKIGTDEVPVAKEGKEAGVLIKPQTDSAKGDKIVVI